MGGRGVSRFCFFFGGRRLFSFCFPGVGRLLKHVALAMYSFDRPCVLAHGKQARRSNLDQFSRWFWGCKGKPKRGHCRFGLFFLTPKGTTCLTRLLS